MSEGDSVSLQVVRKVAEREGVDPTELKPPLHSVVDTDALDSLFRPTDRGRAATGTVEFRYRDYSVTVDATGDVRVAEADPSPDAVSRSAQDTIGD